jgi:hypothetical protein
MTQEEKASDYVMTDDGPISISGIWVRSDHTGRRITLLIEVDGQWEEIIEMKGDGQGITSHIIEPLALRNAIEDKQAILV